MYCLHLSHYIVWSRLCVSLQVFTIMLIININIYYYQLCKMYVIMLTHHVFPITNADFLSRTLRAHLAFAHLGAPQARMHTTRTPLRTLAPRTPYFALLPLQLLKWSRTPTCEFHYPTVPPLPLPTSVPFPYLPVLPAAPFTSSPMTICINRSSVFLLLQ